jgi:hypothetical protein
MTAEMHVPCPGFDSMEKVPPSQHTNALFHPPQSPSLASVARLAGGCHVEARAVVFHVHPELRLCHLELNPRLSGLGMARDVGHGLLDNAEHSNFNLGRESLVQPIGPQIKDQRAQISERLPSDVPDCHQLALDVCPVFRYRQLDGSRVHPHGRQSLANIIVQLAGDPPALFLLSRHQLAQQSTADFLLTAQFLIERGQFPGAVLHAFFERLVPTPLLLQQRAQFDPHLLKGLGQFAHFTRTANAQGIIQFSGRDVASRLAEAL